jgi:hypothetical protein
MHTSVVGAGGMDFKTWPAAEKSGEDIMKYEKRNERTPKT